MDDTETALVSDAERQWFLAEAHRLLGFAKESLVPGSGFGWLDNRGRCDVHGPQELYITCRMTHVFTLGKGLGDAEATRYVQAGVDALNGQFADRVHGGWFHSVGAGDMVDDAKTAYDHAFVILAASSAAVSEVPGAAALLDQALGIFNEHFWDPSKNLVRESFSGDWSNCEPYRGVNSNMHTVEALLAAYDVTRDARWHSRALSIADRVINHWARENDWRIPEHFNESWRPEPNYNIWEPAHPFRPFGATIGHGMEWARLCLMLRASNDSASPEWLLDAARQLYARARHDGWSVDGADGFVYTVDWDGVPVVHERMHWVAAEAVATSAVLFGATGDADYVADFHTWWTYIRSHLLDVDHGSWHHELSRDNGPSGTVWDGKPDVYHALQACLIPLIPLRASIALAVDGLRS